MACDFEILFPAGLRDRLMVAHEALDEVGRLEAQMTVYRDDSAVAEINRSARHRPVSVKPELFRLLRLAVGLSRRTGGAFDAASGALSRCWGFDRRSGRLPEASEIEAALERVGSRHVILDEDALTVEFAKPVEINLGAIGKGYALDCAAETLRAGGLDNALLHAGFSTVLAMGSGPFGGGWPVGVRHPRRPGENVVVLNLKDRALSCSGQGQQNFVIGDRRFGHVIDPRTGWPGGDRPLAAAVAANAAEADALSTAFYLMTPERVEDYCRSGPGVAALLAAENGGESLRLRAYGLEDCPREVVC